MKMPISKRGEARFRGPTSSAKYNESEDNKYLDLLELYQQSNENETFLKESYKAILSEFTALQYYVSTRSEERRVGKECRYRWGTDEERKKKEREQRKEERDRER